MRDAERTLSAVARRLLGERRLSAAAAGGLVAAAWMLFTLDTGQAILQTVAQRPYLAQALSLAEGSVWAAFGDSDPALLRPERLLAAVLATGAVALAAYRPHAAAVAALAAMAYLAPSGGPWSLAMLMAPALTCWAVTRTSPRTGAAVAVVVVALIAWQPQTLVTGSIRADYAIRGGPLHTLILNLVVLGWCLGRLQRVRRPPPRATARLWGSRPVLTAGETAAVVLAAAATFVLARAGTLPSTAYLLAGGTPWGDYLLAGEVVALALVTLAVTAAASAAWRPLAAGATALAAAAVLVVLRGGLSPGEVTATTLVLGMITVYCAGRRDLRAGVGFALVAVVLNLVARPGYTPPAGVWGFAWELELTPVSADVLLVAVGVPLQVLLAARVVANRMTVAAGRGRLAAREAEVEARSALAAERARIARELHDVVAHHVSLVAVRAETAPYTTPGLSPQARAAFAEIAGSSRSALEELRTILRVLRREDGDGPELAPQPGLEELGALVEQGREAGMDLSYEPLSPHVPVPPAVALTAYKVVQEGLSNARRHAPRAPVRVRLHVRDGDLEVAVENGGQQREPAGSLGRSRSGADPAGGAAGGGVGFGLAGMGERVQALAGELDAGPVEEGGWRVRARLPLAPAGVGAS